MTTTELLDVAGDVPWLTAFVLTVVVLSWAVEKIAGLSGPATALTRAWRERDLRKLRREALLRAERRRITAEEDSDRIRDLSTQVEELRREVTALRADRDAARRREGRADRHALELAEYVWRLLHTARAAGVQYVDPPMPPALGPATDPGGRNPAPAVPVPR